MTIPTCAIMSQMGLDLGSRGFEYGLDSYRWRASLDKVEYNKECGSTCADPERKEKEGKNDKGEFNWGHDEVFKVRLGLLVMTSSVSTGGS